MKAILADTGPLYAAYDPSDQFHTQALAEIDSFANQGIEVLLPYPVLLEVHSLVLKRLGTSVGLRLLEELFVGTRFGIKVESRIFGEPRSRAIIQRCGQRFGQGNRAKLKRRSGG